MSNAHFKNNLFAFIFLWGFEAAYNIGNQSELDKKEIKYQDQIKREHNYTHHKAQTLLP